jgi:hypothetical protein
VHDITHGNTVGEEDAIGMTSISQRSNTVRDSGLISLTDGDEDISDSHSSRLGTASDNFINTSFATDMQMNINVFSPQSEGSDKSVRDCSIAANMAIWGSVDYLGLEGRWDQVAIVLGLQPTVQVQRQLEDEYYRLQRLKASGILFNGLA